MATVKLGDIAIEAKSQFIGHRCTENMRIFDMRRCA